VIIVVRQITFEQKKVVKIKQNIFSYIYYFYLVPLIPPKINSISTNQPCQIDIDLKVKIISFIFFEFFLFIKDFVSIENNTRLKVLIKPVSNEQSYEKSYHSINDNHSVQLNNLCAYPHMNDTQVLYLCWSNSIGDGPLSFAHYFHIQSPPPVDVSITLLNVSVLSSREIYVKWDINRILTSIGYRVRWIAGNETNKENSLITSYNESSVVLDNLIPFTVYKIMLNTFNINGDGPTREADLVRTDEDGMCFSHFYCIHQLETRSHSVVPLQVINVSLSF
jgi:hypothetical protein